MACGVKRIAHAAERMDFDALPSDRVEYAMRLEVCVFYVVRYALSAKRFAPSLSVSCRLLPAS